MADGITAIPHPDNGRRCICGQAVYLTPDGWKNRSSQGSHTQPPRRTIRTDVRTTTATSRPSHRA